MAGGDGYAPPAPSISQTGVRVRRQAGDGRWSAREAGAQARSQEQRQEVAQQMRAYLEREGVAMPRREARTLWERAAEQLRMPTIAPESLRIALHTNQPQTVTVPPHTTWANAEGVTFHNSGWHNVTFSWDPGTFRRMRHSLDEATRSFERINATARDITHQVAKLTCDCGNPQDEFWEHTEEGCEFRPHQVELTHVD